MKIVDNIVPGEDAWFEWRRDGITATDAAILLDRSPYKTWWRLWAEKSGFAREVDLSMNPLVTNGKVNEDIARQYLESKIGQLILPACVESSEDPLFRASLDGLLINNEPVEIKCPSEKVFRDVLAKGENSLAFHLYYPQVQHQMLVTGAQRGCLFFYYEGEHRGFWISRDEAMLRQIRSQGARLRKQVDQKIEPPKDPNKDLYIPAGEKVQEWIIAAEEYRFFEVEIKELKERLAELQEKQNPQLERLKSMMGEYLHADYCGLMVTRYNAVGKVNYKKLLEDKLPNLTEAEVDAYRDPSSSRCRITLSENLLPRHIVDEATLAPIKAMPKRVDSAYF